MKGSDVHPLEEQVQRARGGDRGALAELLTAHADSLRQWIERRLDHRLRGRLSASDVMQEIYLSADQRLEHYGQLDDMPFGVWIRLLAQQRLIDLQRKHLIAGARAAGREVRIDAGSGSEPLAARLPGSVTAPSRVAIRHEADAQLAHAIDSLAASDRQILVLRHFEALSNEDAAARLGLTRSAATKRYVRALARLKERLDADPGPISRPPEPEADHDGARPGR